jgi:hypothetical protein
LVKRTTSADQNGGDPISSLQFCCRFISLVKVVDDRAAQDSFSTASLQKNQAYGDSSDDDNCAADDEVSFIHDNLLV